MLNYPKDIYKTQLDLQLELEIWQKLKYKLEKFI